MPEALVVRQLSREATQSHDACVVRSAKPDAGVSLACNCVGHVDVTSAEQGQATLAKDAAPAEQGQATLAKGAAPWSCDKSEVIAQPLLQLPAKVGLLGPIAAKLKEAAVLEALGKVQDLSTVPFVEGLNMCEAMLDRLGGNMGSYLRTNIVKLQKSKAPADKASFRAWMLSELPVHAETRYKEYVDNSAWMANLWIGWMLEFFTEMFALLHSGEDTKASAENSYKRTLHHHHNIFQRVGFSSAIRQLPLRAKLLNLLRGDSGAGSEGVLREMEEFVRILRPIVQFCLHLNEDVSLLMQAERKAFVGLSSKAKLF